MSGRAALWIGVLLVATLAVSGIAHADFSIQTVTIKESILPGDSALFHLDVTNTGTAPDRYTIESGEYGYILYIDPSPSQVLPNATGTYGVEIQPRSFINTGTHIVPITVRSQNTGTSKNVNLVIYLQNPNRTQGVYVPSIALSVGAAQQVDPRQPMVLDIHMRNRNARVYTQQDPITVIIDSDLFHKEFTTQLGGVGTDGDRTSELRIPLDPHEAPGDHPLVVKLLVGNQTVATENQQYSIIPYGQIEQSSYQTGGFFKYTTVYKVHDEGNIPKMVNITYPASILQRPFITSSHNYHVATVDGINSIVINESLDPQQDDTITITQNYRLLVLLIILAIFSVIGYYILRSPVVVGKEAGITGSHSEGVSEVRVRVLVKNRSSKTMRNLRIIDRISGMADIIKEDALGTLKPTKVVKKKGQGTLLRWDLDQLEPFEERIITYRAKTGLKLVGDVTLPSAKVKYDLPSGRERTSHSNDVTVSRGA